MKTGILAIAAAVGLSAFTAERAEAHHGSFDVAFHLGPAYVRYHDGYRHAWRVHRDWHRYRPVPRRSHWRWRPAQDLWHRCHDGRFYRYYDRGHWRYHERRGHRHRH